MIAINNISQHYGSSQILWELDLQTRVGSVLHQAFMQAEGSMDESQKNQAVIDASLGEGQ